MKRFLLLLAILAVGFVVVILLLPPAAPPPAPPPPPPVAKAPKVTLQADAEGRYVASYHFAVGHFRFTGFSLRPDAYVTFTSTGMDRGVSCQQATITAATIRLRCEDPEVGIVTIDGRFLARAATQRLEVPVVSAMVTVRSGSGDILYSARDAFAWDSAR